MNSLNINWGCKHTWRRASYNTMWCLIGCSIGDFATIFYFQSINHDWSVLSVMILAILNGILTSIMLETIILSRQMRLKLAFKTAIGMSLISMIAMEISMNITDILLIGGAYIALWAMPIMLFMGWVTALPYNYFRLKAYGKSCH